MRDLLEVTGVHACDYRDAGEHCFLDFDSSTS